MILYLGNIAWTIFYDTIYAHQDKEDDALIGVKSTALRFGDRTVAWLTGFMIATVTAALLAGLLATLDGRLLAPLAVIVGCWAFGWRLAWQLRRLDIDDPALCLKLFRDNREAGLILFAGFFVAGWV